MTDGAFVIAVGADGLGRDLKDMLADELRRDPRVRDLRDFGVHAADDPTAYPTVGISVAEAVARGEADRALLVCGTGIGMAISANKVPGIRAAVAHDPYSPGALGALQRLPGAVHGRQHRGSHARPEAHLSLAGLCLRPSIRICRQGRHHQRLRVGYRAVLNGLRVADPESGGPCARLAR